MSDQVAASRVPSGMREAAREVTGRWWTWLVAGILMTVLAFWTAGQFFAEKAYLLLVMAGIWALMEGVNDITRAFALRRLHDET
jgi:uncharacterized membrane protein HdeD (DUF308 family)